MQMHPHHAPPIFARFPQERRPAAARHPGAKGLAASLHGVVGHVVGRRRQGKPDAGEGDFSRCRRRSWRQRTPLTGRNDFDGEARRRVANSLVDAFGDAGGRAASRQNVAKDDDK